MKRTLLPLLALALVTAAANSAYAGGLLIPSEPEVPPLALLNHHVDVALEDQVAVTKVRQTFRNHTSRKLEATYVFPVPKGASLREFAMWVNGKRVQGELLPAERAKKLYAEIVRQTQNPALLDYIGADMLRLKIFPIPPQGDQKVEVSFTAIAKKEHGLVEYVYPLKTDRLASSTLEEFRLTIDVKSQQPLANIYSPTHEVTVKHKNDHHAVVSFHENAATLDRDFQLYYTNSGQDIGVTALKHRPISAENGYVMLLVSPRAELARDQKIPRDIVFVLDTSGSMREDKKMEQAKKALQHCLAGLSADDRFGLIEFATSVNHYRYQLVPANDEHKSKAKRWVAGLDASGGTAINEALESALEMRGKDDGRMFTVVFFTDGQPTIGERKAERIVDGIAKKNTANTRIFSFGVGDDLNAVLLDQIAERTRAVSHFVRPKQNLEAKVASFFDKINKPVLANLKLTTSDNVQLAEVYPARLPDLFHGDQLVVLAQYQGSGHAAVTLEGKIGMHDKKFVYELNFPKQTDQKPFVEELWARRKVGYLLDQIRTGGEQKELVDEVIKLAKTYGITTPYTSYLIMPDAPIQLASAGGSGGGGMISRRAPAALDGNGYFTPGPKGGGDNKQIKLEDFVRRVHRENGGLTANRGRFQKDAFDRLPVPDAAGPAPTGLSPPRVAAINEQRKRLQKAKELQSTLELAQMNYQQGKWRTNQVQKLGVDLAVCTNALKCQTQLTANAIRRVASRRCMEIGGVWIDEAFHAKTPTVSVKAQSDAYFRILERQPQMKEVFQLGNHVVWIAPNGAGLVIDTTAGQEKISDAEIDRLFVK